MKSINAKSSHTNNKENQVLESIKLSKIILPVIIGIGVVIYLMLSQLDIDQFNAIQWNVHALFWICMALVVYVIRHAAYAWRLREMTDNFFSWKKSMELIVIWEFSSSVSPTSVGGSAVALFLLSQEKLSTAKTVSIVIYSMILDTLFFVLTLPLLILFYGPLVVRPGLTDFSLDGYLYTLFGIYIFILAYGILFIYGLFFSPEKIRAFLFWLSKWKILKRFKRNLVSIGSDVVKTSKELKHKDWRFHARCMTGTTIAWFGKFLAANFIIIALIPETPLTIYDQLLIYGRGEVMHTIAQFSPTPGGSGVSEYLFGGFFADYISPGIAFVVALIWRLITYYPYLLIGALIIPNWIRKILNRRRLEKVSTPI